MLRDFRISELRTLLKSVTPSILRKNCSTYYSLLSLLFTYERCDVKQSGGEETA